MCNLVMAQNISETDPAGLVSINRLELKSSSIFYALLEMRKVQSTSDRFIPSLKNFVMKISMSEWALPAKVAFFNTPQKFWERDYPGLFLPSVISR